MQENCPLLGEKPEALLLLEFDLRGPSGKRTLSDVLGSPLPSILGSPGAPLRWALGFSSRFFADHSRADLMPHGLRPLQYNGDERYRPELQESPGHLLAVAGGLWEEVLCATERLRAILSYRDCPIVAVNIGFRQGTDRDHTGFLDGTSNLQELGEKELCRCIFIQPEDDPVFGGGTYIVVRKYEEDLRMWNTLSPGVQEQLIGRQKESGVFLDGGHSWTPKAWDHTPPTAHVRRAHPRDAVLPPEEQWKDRIYRRSITYREGRGRGDISAGVLFIALVRDPHRQVVRIHNERLLPERGTRDHFLDSGYVSLKRSVCYILPSVKSGSLKESIPVSLLG